MSRKHRKLSVAEKGASDRPGEKTARWDRVTWGLVGILMLVTVAAFAGVARCGFIDFDDDEYVTLNPHVWNGLSDENVAWAWMNIQGSSWMPLTWLSLQLDGEITREAGGSPADFATPGKLGPPMHASVYHVQNLVWHAGSVALLFVLLFRLTGRRWESAAITLLWAVHPLRVESVAWVVERKDVLAMFWGLFAIYCYVRWREGRKERTPPRWRWVWYGAMCIAFSFSLMSKAMFVPLPFMLLLLDFWPLGRLGNLRDSKAWTAVVIDKIPLFAIAAFMSAVTFFAQSSSGAVKSMAQYGFGGRLENAAVSCMRYIVMQVNCWDLGVFYPANGPPSGALAAIAVVVLVLVTGVCVWQMRARPWLVVGWLWFLGTLVPVIGIVQVGDQTHADRYTYLPTIGLLIMVMFSIPRAWWDAARSRVVLAGAVAAAGIVLMALTMRQVGFWHDSTALFEHTLAITDKNYYMHYTLSIAYIRAGEKDKAEEVLRESVRERPDFSKGYGGLANLYLLRGDYVDAVPVLEEAEKLEPNDAEYPNMRAFALMSLHRFVEALAAAERSLKLDPSDVLTQRNYLSIKMQLADATRAATMKSQETQPAATAPAMTNPGTKPATTRD